MTSESAARKQQPTPPTEVRTGLGEDWRVLDSAVSGWFEAPSLTAGAALVSRLAASRSRLPEVDVRANGLRIRVDPAEPAATGIMDEISAGARDLGLSADPSALLTVDLAVDTADRSSVSDFWRTVASYDLDDAGNLRDPARRDPAIRFHPVDEVPPLRSRFHVDVVRPPEVVDEVRVAVDQEPFGVYGVALADAEGNEVDLVPGDPLGDGPETADWRVVFAAVTHYPTESAAQVSALVTAAARLADAAGVPLLIDIRSEGVTFDSGKDLWEDAAQPADAHFADLAAGIQSAAHQLGLTADPNGSRFVQFGLDVVDIAAARTFWTTVLGYRQDQRDGVTDIYDPSRLNPEILFQDLDVSDDRCRQRDRIRLELTVPADRAQARIEAAVAAGARIVDDHNQDRLRLADPEGNEFQFRWE